MSVNSKMTAIADKIRALLGISGTMGLDAMATHLGTEQSNITAALAALTEKGVTVPAGSTSDALAGLIGGIDAGGGAKVTTGTFTEASDITFTQKEPFLIEHKSGFIPRIFVVVPENQHSKVADKLVFSFLLLKDAPTESSTKAIHFSAIAKSGSSVSGNGTNAGQQYYISTTNLTFIKSTIWNTQYAVSIPYYNTSDAVIIAGDTYRWFAVSDWEGKF